MKTIFRSLTLLCLLCSSLWAQKSKPLPNSLLWKISKKENKDASYLMGTIHMICAEDYFWTPAMQKSFDQTRHLCIEMDISNPSLQQEAGMLMLDLSGGTLRDYFDKEEEYQLVARYIEDSMKQSLQMAERLKPVALYMLHTMGLIKGPCNETVSYELKLIEQAKAKGSAISGLETLGEQMSALESIPVDTIIRQMVRIAKGEKNDEAETQKMIHAYKQQDLETLNSLTIKGTEENGMDAKVFIDNRNQKWIAPMSRMMQEGPTFFAVGAGHVYGLLRLLKAAGYTVEAVK